MPAVSTLADVRTMREPGKRMRSRLLDAAVELFKAKGQGGVAVAEIAAAAGAYPSQVTYYFRTKEALFVEAACRDVLHAAAAVEQAGRRATGKDDYARRLTAAALSSPALPLFAEALLLARRREELRPLIARTLDRLHEEGARAVAERCSAQRWRLSAPPDAVARSFWATVLGIALESGGAGDAFDLGAAQAAVLATLSTTRARRP